MTVYGIWYITVYNGAVHNRKKSDDKNGLGFIDFEHTGNKFYVFKAD